MPHQRPLHEKVAFKRTRQSTPAELALWKYLRNYGFGQDVLLDGWMVDFYRSDVKVAVEVDGSIHERDWKQAQDRAKEADLERLDIHLFRVPNEPALQHTAMVVKQILAVVALRKPRRPAVDVVPGPEAMFEAARERQREAAKYLSKAKMPTGSKRGRRKSPNGAYHGSPAAFRKGFKIAGEDRP